MSVVGNFTFIETSIKDVYFSLNSFLALFKSLSKVSLLFSFPIINTNHPFKKCCRNLLWYISKKRNSNDPCRPDHYSINQQK